LLAVRLPDLVGLSGLLRVRGDADDELANGLNAAAREEKLRLQM
jgi:hypothetical protein